LKDKAAMKGFSIIIIPKDSKRVLKLSVGKALSKIVVYLVGGFVLVNLLLFAWNIYMLRSSVQPFLLRAERKNLRNELAVLRSQLDSLRAQYKLLSRYNAELFALADIEKPAAEYAVGGPQLASYSIRDAENIAFAIDSLIFAVKSESDYLKKVEKELKSRERLLRHTPSIMPMKGYISSGFGMRNDPITGRWSMHEGIDIIAPRGTPVHATADGRVKFTGIMHGFGKLVVIDHIWFETRYAHLDKILVKRGQRVSRGDVIGTCGRTGKTTGVHLHYEVRVAGKPVNPKNYILPERFVVD